MEGRPVEKDTLNEGVEIELTIFKHVRTQDRIEILECFYKLVEHLIDAINSAYQSTLKLPPSERLLRHSSR